MWMKSRVLVYVLLLALLAGCAGGAAKQDPQGTEPTTDATGDESMDYTEMTDQEKELLSAAYADADRIREGKLFEHQLEALEELRAGLTYLEDKYPDFPLLVLSFQPANKFNPWAVLSLRDESGDTYTVTVTPTDGSYVCADDYYGALLREAYDEYVSGVLQTGGFSALSYTTFPEPAGSEIGADITVEKLLEIQPRLSRSTHLFSEETQSHDDTAASLRECLVQAGLYGSYTLYFVPREQLGSAAELEEGRNAWEKVSFNCFDIG